MQSVTSLEIRNFRALLNRLLLTTTVKVEQKKISKHEKRDFLGR
jgi:hypothetical protein